MNNERMNRVLKEMAQQHLPQLVVSDQASISYLTGQSIDPGERLVALIIRENGHHVAVINRLFPVSESDLGMPIIAVDDTDEGMGVLKLAKELDKLGVHIKNRMTMEGMVDELCQLHLKK